jgi:ABC-2 type transport system ATP-binding protein
MLYFGRHKGYRGKKLTQRSEWLLRELELWDRRNDEVRELSRGMQQKVAIACALVADPPIVLLDEPTLGLDVQAARTVKGWIKRLTSEQGKTVLLTTHQLDLAQELCDRVAIIDEGSLVADRPVVELLSLFRTDYYSIRVRGRTDGRLDRFTGLEIAEVEGDTVLSGTFEDQQELHQVLRGIQELGLSLVSVKQTQNDLEDVFVRLIEGRA